MSIHNIVIIIIYQQIKVYVDSTDGHKAMQKFSLK